MDKRQEQQQIRPEDATVAPPGQVHIMFICGTTGNILAADGIKLRRLKLPDGNQGKIIKVSTADGHIKLDQVGDNSGHTTLIGLDKGAGGPDEWHIRIPVGVSFFQTDIPKGAPAGYPQAFFFQTGDGYNILPKFLPLNSKQDEQQLVNELVLVTSHVPPRRSHINDADTEDIPRLKETEMAAKEVSDMPKPK